MRFIDPQHDAQAANRVFTLVGWLAERAWWPEGQRAAVQLPNDTDIEVLNADLQRIARIELEFPKWTDGRAYSQARLLRSRSRYLGEVRATGEVLVDMLPLLQRTGFNAVQLRTDQSLDSAQRALRFFAGHYQGDVNETQPLFGRAAAPALLRAEGHA